jgi:hypothetical protein
MAGGWREKAKTAKSEMDRFRFFAAWHRRDSPLVLK